MALTPYYARYLLSQQDLLSRILSFNRDFHAKQRRFIEAKAPEQISDTLYRMHPELAQFHAEHNLTYCFENSADRLCLIRLRELDKLVVYLGACISAPQLARITNKQDLAKVEEQIGRDVYDFALDYGYLINSFDYEPNLDSLRDDCTYLGLCALKCLKPLFSSKELCDYFLEVLINYTKLRHLNPNIITADTHLLTVVPDQPNHKAPSPVQMNTPVQFTAIDAHPKLDKDMPPRKFEDSGNPVLSMSRARINTKVPIDPTNPLSFASSVQIIEPPHDFRYQPEVTKQRYAPYAEVASKIPVGAIINKDLLKTKTEQQEKATKESTPQWHHGDDIAGATLNEERKAAAILDDAQKEQQQALEEQKQAQPDLEALSPTPSLWRVDNRSNKQDTTRTRHVMGYEPPKKVKTVNADPPEFHYTPQPHEAASTLEAKKEAPQMLEQSRLVTLEFGPRQVFNMTKLILESKIDEHWYDYLV